MCGLSGGIIGDKLKWSKSILEELILASQARGVDAAGVAFFCGPHIEIVKRNGSATELVGDNRFKSGLTAVLAEISPQLGFFAHSRLATSEAVEFTDFNQPLGTMELTGIHNGVVTQLGNEVITVGDSTRLFNALGANLSEYSDIEKTFSLVFQNLKGTASVAVLLPKFKKMVLATNTGSIYYVYSKSEKLFYFASERAFLAGAKDVSPIVQLKNNCAVTIDIESHVLSTFEMNTPVTENFLNGSSFEMAPLSAASTLKRCKKCILPHTYPLIEFDENGVCNFCRRYAKQVVHGEEALLKFLEPYRSKDGSADCLVGLSGGRDSSYGLHLLKTRLGMNPIAYTFDWGLTTETSRRNQARLCGQLGIEHIIRSADLSKKRKNIQQNVDAFLKRPHLGMVPLFMAGDKEFYEYGRTLQQPNQLNLTVFCAGHSLEQRDFMTGFCGVDQNLSNNKRLYQFDYLNKIRLAIFYSSQYVLNPAYINISLFDNLKSFLYSFMYKDDFLYLYEYWPWNESEIEKVLAIYGWEADASYGKNQWRMGDGQTAFTNFIYYTVAGFSEFDNFRSNQIREGLISRDEALKLVADDNKPKVEMIKSFAATVGLNLDEVVRKISNIPKLY